MKEVMRPLVWWILREIGTVSFIKICTYVLKEIDYREREKLPCSASNLACVRLCTSKYSFNLNLFPQFSWSQIHCFSCECVCSCLFKEHFWTNSLPQIWHLKGFSPVCVLICRVSDHLLVNSFWHNGKGQCWISPSPSPSSVDEKNINVSRE